MPEVVTTADGETLEIAWSAPAGIDARAVAVLTHPHPLYGGDFDNVVPAALARTLPTQGIATLRVNFRGVGASTGTHDGGRAEIGDVDAAVATATATFPDVPAIGVGYSFGADVLLAADPSPLVAVVAVAPPLALLPLDDLVRERGTVPTLVLSPAHDQFRPAAEATATVADWPDTTVVEIPGADHFMAGATSFVVDRVIDLVDDLTRPG